MNIYKLSYESDLSKIVNSIRRGHRRCIGENNEKSGAHQNHINMHKEATIRETPAKMIRVISFIKFENIKFKPHVDVKGIYFVN